MTFYDLCIFCKPVPSVQTPSTSKATTDVTPTTLNELSSTSAVAMSLTAASSTTTASSSTSSTATSSAVASSATSSSVTCRSGTTGKTSSILFLLRSFLKAASRVKSNHSHCTPPLSNETTSLKVLFASESFALL